MPDPWWKFDCDCCGPGSGCTVAATYTMTYSVAGLVVGILYGAVSIYEFPDDFQVLIRVALCIVAGWCTLQLLISILFLVGVFKKRRKLAIPYIAFRLLSIPLAIAVGIALAAKFPKPEDALEQIGSVKSTMGIVFSTVLFIFLEYECGGIAWREYDKLPSHSGRAMTDPGHWRPEEDALTNDEAKQKLLGETSDQEDSSDHDLFHD